MFRKLLLTGALSIAAVAGFSTSADAHERPIRHEHRGHHARYEVRIFRHGCWDVHSSFRTRREAYREMIRLRHTGMVVELRGRD